MSLAALLPHPCQHHLNQLRESCWELLHRPLDAFLTCSRVWPILRAQGDLGRCSAPVCWMNRTHSLAPRGGAQRPRCQVLTRRASDLLTPAASLAPEYLDFISLCKHLISALVLPDKPPLPSVWTDCGSPVATWRKARREGLPGPPRHTSGNKYTFCSWAPGKTRSPGLSDPPPLAEQVSRCPGGG